MLLKLTDKKLQTPLLINPNCIDDITANRDGEGSYIKKGDGRFYLVAETVEEITKLLGKARVSSLDDLETDEDYNV